MSGVVPGISLPSLTSLEHKGLTSILFANETEELVCNDDRGVCIGRMNLVQYEGESYAPFISRDGLRYLQHNWRTSKKDVLINSYAKSGTTMTLCLVYLILRAFHEKSKEDDCDVGSSLPSSLSSSADTTASRIAGFRHELRSDPLNSSIWPELQVSQEILRRERLVTQSELVLTMNEKDLNSSLKTNKKKKKPCEWESFLTKTNDDKIYSRRIYKSHASVKGLPIVELNPLTQIVHICRNPKDVVCSFLDFFRKEPFVKFKGSMTAMFDLFITGKVVNSSWLEFEKDWWLFYQNPRCQIFWLHYEDLLTDPIKSVRELSVFLAQNETVIGKDGLRPQLSEKQINRICQQILFKNMHNEVSSFMGKALVNKGRIGRWKTILTEEQSNIIDEMFLKPLADDGLHFTME